MNSLRFFIRAILAEAHDNSKPVKRKKKKGDELLVEPDMPKDSNKKKKNEINAIGMGGGSGISRGTIRGVSTPLGTDASYPSKRKKKKSAKPTSPGTDWYKNY